MQERSRRIARNTILLYGRSIIIMIIAFYTSRLVLEALGIDNFGVYSLVGGIIGFAYIFRLTMEESCRRYIAHALGSGEGDLSRIFSSIVNVHLLAALIAVAALEAGGLLFLNFWADIPAGSHGAANRVLQCAIFGVFANLMTAPYEGLITAHERMRVFAAGSIAEALAKLAICFALLRYGGDRLRLYALLMAGVAAGLWIFYAAYCRVRYPQVRYRPRVGGKGMRGIMAFSGWTMLESGTVILNTNGVTMLINAFFGVAFNATYGVVMSVNHCVSSFVLNFTVAYTPQITKSYAAGDLGYCFELANRTARYSWYVMLVFMVPVSIEAGWFLRLWLTEVPPMGAAFVRLMLFQTLMALASQNLLKILQANGNLRAYSIAYSLFASMGFALTWAAYALGAPVWACFVIVGTVYALATAVRLKYVSALTSYSARSFVREVVGPCLTVAAAAFAPWVVVDSLCDDTLLRFLIVTPLSLLTTCAVIYLLGLSAEERSVVKTRLHRYL